MSECPHEKKAREYYRDMCEHDFSKLADELIRLNAINKRLLFFINGLSGGDVPDKELIRMSNLNGENIANGRTELWNDDIHDAINEAVWEGAASVRARNALDIRQLLKEIGKIK